MIVVVFVLVGKRGKWILVRQISTGVKALWGASVKQRQDLSERSQGKPEKGSGRVSWHEKLESEGEDSVPEGMVTLQKDLRGVSMPLEAAQRVFCLVVNRAVEWVYGKQEDHRWVLVLRMTKAESSWALVAGRGTALALSHLVLLQAAHQHSFPSCPGFGNKVWLQKKWEGKVWDLAKRHLPVVELT